MGIVIIVSVCVILFIYKITKVIKREQYLYQKEEYEKESKERYVRYISEELKRYRRRSAIEGGKAKYLKEHDKNFFKMYLLNLYRALKNLNFGVCRLRLGK